MLRKFLAVVLLLVGAGGALALYWPFSADRVALELHGVVEIQEVRLGSKIGGRVADVMVREGEHVTRDQPLVAFEMPDVEAELEQWQAQLEAARAEQDKVEKGLPKDIEAARAAAEAAHARYERVRQGSRPEEVRIAGHQADAAAAELKFARSEQQRVGELFARNAASKADLENARDRVDKAQSNYEAAKLKHDMLASGGWEADVAVAKADWLQAEASHEKLRATQRAEEALVYARIKQIQGKIAEIRADLDEAVVEAPADAVVEVVAVRKGDLVAPSQPVLRILRSDDMWVKVFVPETQLGRVRLGQEVRVYVDTYPDRAFTGRVYYKGDISEFTPRNVQSADERRFQVFPVKVRVDDPQGVFNAGMAARVVFPAPAECPVDSE